MKKQASQRPQAKKAYSRPSIVAQGSVEKITLEINKQYGVSDGFLFQGDSIGNVS